MKRTLLLATAITFCLTPAYATVTGDEIHNNSGVANTGQINHSVINSGPGAGGLSADVDNRNTNLNANSNRQGQFQAQSQSARSSVRDSGNSANTNVVEAQDRSPVSTAYAAPLTAADDTCMGSSSVGAQAVGFGISAGSTWHDEDCVRRKDSRELRLMGYTKAGVALMCQNEQVRQAMEDAGTPCPVTVGRDTGSLARAEYQPLTDAGRAKH